MAPTESFIGPQPRLHRRRAAALAMLIVAVNLPAPVRAQDQPPVEPTIGEAVATERAPGQGQTPPPTQPAQDDGLAANASAPAGQAPTGQAPTANAAPVPPAAVAAPASEPLRSAAVRPVTPPPSPQQLRQRTLDTSFPAEQPQQDVPEPPREVNAPSLAPVSPRGPSRRTVARVVDGVTVLTNVTDEPESENGGYNTVVASRPLGASVADSPREPLTVGNAPRDVSVHSNALSPATKAEASAGLGSWLWVLAGFAALLLVPIGVLLTRPVRKN